MEFFSPHDGLTPISKITGIKSKRIQNIKRYKGQQEIPTKLKASYKAKRGARIFKEVMKQEDKKAQNLVRRIKFLHYLQEPETKKDNKFLKLLKNIKAPLINRV